MPDVRIQTGSAVASTLSRPASPPTGSSSTPPVPATGFVALLPPSFGQILGDMMTTAPAVRAASASTGRDAMKPTGTPETALAAPTDNTLAVSESAKPTVALRPKEDASRAPDGDRSATPSRNETEPASTGNRSPVEPSPEAVDEHAGEEDMTDAAVLVTATTPTTIPAVVEPETEVTAPVLPTTPTPLPDDGASSPAPESPKAGTDLSAGFAPEEAAATEETPDSVNTKPIAQPNRPEGLPSDLLEAAKPPPKEAPPVATPPKPEVAGAAAVAAETEPTPEAPSVDSMPRQVTRIVESAVVATKAAAQATAEVPLSNNDGSPTRESGSGSASPAAINPMAGSTRAIAGASAGGASGELSGGLSGNLAGSESGGPRAITSVAGRGDALTFTDRMTALTEARANQAEMIDRIVQQTKMGVENGQTRIRMQLNPPALGHLRLDLGVRDGVLSARLQTETQAAQVVLQTHLDTLRDSLEQQGIIVGTFEISVRQQGQSGASFAFGRPLFSDNASRAASRRARPEPEPALAEIGAGSSSRGWHLVDLFA